VVSQGLVDDIPSTILPSDQETTPMILPQFVDCWQAQAALVRKKRPMICMLTGRQPDDLPTAWAGAGWPIVEGQ